MRKALAYLLVLLLLGVCLCAGVSADSVTDYSPDAVIQFCDRWNAWFEKNEPLISCGYILSDDGKTVEGPTTIEIVTPLDRLPHFAKESINTRKENKK